MSEELLKNLKKLSEEHEKYLSDIREKMRIIDTYPKARALVGKCFKYRNGHVFGGYKPGWVYKHIVDTNGMELIVDSFETEGPFKIEFTFGRTEQVSYFSHSALSAITLKQYNKEFNKMIKAIVYANKRKTI